MLITERDGYLFYAAGGIVCLCAMTVAVWWSWWTNPAITPWVATGACVVGSLALLIQGFRRHLAGENIELGLEGEQSVSDLLADLGEHGYHVRHDLPGLRRNTNIDHVLVGPTGVFVIETKTRSKNKGEKIRYDWRAITIGNAAPSTEAIDQARACSNDMRTRLRGLLDSQEIPLRGIVVYPGWWVESPRTRSKPDDIWVLNPKGLAAWLTNEPVRLSEAQICRIVGELDRLANLQAQKRD